VRGPDYFFNDLIENRGGKEGELAAAKEIVDITYQQYEDAVANLNYGNHHYNLYSPTLLKEWDRLTKDLKDNRVKVVMGQMSYEDWDKYVAELTSSETYQTILKELKESYAEMK
jgi:hypothetical protein